MAAVAELGSFKFKLDHPIMDAPRTKSFSRLAANLSWVCPVLTIIIFALLIFSRQIVPRKIIALVASGALCLIAVGLIFGIAALFGISKQGTKGILAPAIVGIIINGLMLAFVVTNFMKARFRAMQPRGGIETPPVVAIWSTKALQRPTAAPRASRTVWIICQ